MNASSFYPPTRKEYFSVGIPDVSRPMFQGDIFSGCFGAFWAHPSGKALERDGRPLFSQPLKFPLTRELLDDVHLDGNFGIILPQPCDYADGEKGDNHPQRLIAPLFHADKHYAIKKLRRAEFGNQIWIPDWTVDNKEWYADLWLATTIDRAFLDKRKRVASLSVQGWVSLNHHLMRYFTGLDLDRSFFIENQAAGHPDLSSSVPNVLPGSL